jgi:hypothetical protein
MKKVLLTVLAGALAGATFAPVLAADDSDTFTFNGEVRARYEYLNNYLDVTDNDESGDPNDDSYSLAPYRVMVGITGNFANNVVAHADLQYAGLFGDEFQPQKDVFPPVGQFFTPYLFFTQGVQLYTGWLEMTSIGGSDFGARLGRQEHTYGTELFMGDNDYYDGTSFDGLRGMWKHGNNDLNLFYYKIAEDNFIGPGTDGGANDSDFFGATYDYNFASGWGTVGGYVLLGQDLDGNGPVFFPDSKVITYGGRWNRGMMNGDKLNMFDWNIEAAGQAGDVGEPAGGPSVDLKAYVAEGWFGWNFNVGNSHGRVHAGIYLSSGDDTSTTDEIESFTPMYGDFHANNRLGDLDWIEQFGVSNVTDINVGYEHWFGDRHYVMAAYHMFTVTEDNGAPSDDIGDEIDLGYGFMYSKNLSFQVTLGQVSPGDVFGPDTDPVERVTGQAKLRW